MSLRGTVYTRAVWPALFPHCRGLATRLGRLRREAWASQEESRKRQWAAVQRMLVHAWGSCSFYRQRFRALGAEPQDIRTPADLERFPVLTRAELRENLEGLCSDRYTPADLLPAASGGTTDTPVPMRRDRGAIARKEAVQQAFWEWAGVEGGAKVFWLWGAAADFSQNPSWRWRLYERYILRQMWAPTSLLNPEVLEGYRQRLNRFQPEAIGAYPTPLYHFCEYLRECGRPVHRPRAVICTAEALLPHQRSLVAEVFGCPIFEHYGSREFGMIAAECEAHQGLHLHTGAAYVEFRPVANGASRLCELLVTDLLNDGMPLIRYQINDCVEAAPEQQRCACGRVYPLLPAVVGRTTDTFRLPNGSLVPGVALTNRVIKVAPGLAKTQVIQETLRDFRLRYVAGPAFSPADLEPLRRKLDEFLGRDVRWEFEAVAEIGREASGKTRFCICKLSPAERAG